MKNKTKGIKKLTLLLLLMIALGASIVAGAYWASLVVAPPATNSGDVLVTIEEGKEVETTITIEPAGIDPTGKPLVPYGYEDANSESNLNIVFNHVMWDGVGAKGAKGAKGALSVSVVSFHIGTQVYTQDSEGLYGGLFTITLPAVKEITAGTPEVVNINLEFTHEPQSKDVYDLIANNTITIVFGFEVTPN
ncbi:MAG: hypothetical protein M0Q87_14980 [Ottowia sp.]|nr:hypothetical protein [Ottowia sp.]